MAASREGVDIKVRVLEGRRARGELDHVDDGLGRLGRTVDTTGRRLGAFSRLSASANGGMRLAAGGALYGGAAIGGVLAIGVAKSTEAWEESRKVAAQTGAVLRSTGGVANVTAGDVEDLAGALSRKSGIDDEAIQSGENLLLTFKGVRNEAGAGNDVFDQATTAALDMSVALGTDVTASAMQVGKALQDPEKGMLRLARAGVDFTQSQKDQVAVLVKTGDTMAAQKIILGELETQFGGSAAAQATPLAKLKVSADNLQETLGRGLAPAVDSVARELLDMSEGAAPKLERFADGIERIFDRDNRSTGDKLQLGFELAKKDFGPVARDLGQAVRGARLGEKLGDAIEDGAPKIADAAARAAPRAAGAFLNAFQEAGTGGQLLTAGVLLGKLGAFRVAGRGAVGLFSRTFLTGAAANRSKHYAAGLADGRAYSTGYTAGSAAAGGPLGKGGRLAKLGKFGRVAGRAAGPAALGALAAEMSLRGAEPFGELLENPDIKPGQRTGRGRETGSFDLAGGGRGGDPRDVANARRGRLDGLPEGRPRVSRPSSRDMNVAVTVPVEVDGKVLTEVTAKRVVRGRYRAGG